MVPANVSSTVLRFAFRDMCPPTQNNMCSCVSVCSANAPPASIYTVALSVSIFLTTPDPHRTRQNVWKRNCRSSFHDPCGAAKRHTTFVLSHDSTLLFPMHTCLWMKCAPAPQALLPTEPAHASQESMDFKRRFPALAKPALEQRHSLFRQNSFQTAVSNASQAGIGAETFFYFARINFK